MKVLTWNIHRAPLSSKVWKIISEINPDIILLQEVREIPKDITKIYEILTKTPITKTGNLQRFKTALLVRGKILSEIKLSSEYPWVNKELEIFSGNLISCKVLLKNGKPVNVISVYSPAWKINQERLKGIDTTAVRLTSHSYLNLTEILWAALKQADLQKDTWIIGGDFNSSETFDKEWQIANGITRGIVSNGNSEIIERMNTLGLKECLREFHGKIVPTYKHTNKQILHQIDHLYVSRDLYTKIKTCAIGDQSIIFGESLSDHLPIIADFNELSASLLIG